MNWFIAIFIIVVSFLVSYLVLKLAIKQGRARKLFRWYKIFKN